MTRKDYKLIAEAIKNAREYFLSMETPENEKIVTNCLVGVATVTSFMAAVLNVDNPRFDKDKFFRAAE